MKSNTGFLNVDLDIYSRSNLAPLVAALESRTSVLYVGREGARHAAHLELRSFPKNADTAIRSLAALIRALPQAARKLWNQATTREFNIGIQAAETGQPQEISLSTITTQIVASLRGRIMITVYCPDRSGDTRRRRT